MMIHDDMISTKKNQILNDEFTYKKMTKKTTLTKKNVYISKQNLRIISIIRYNKIIVKLCVYCAMLYHCFHNKNNYNKVFIENDVKSKLRINRDNDDVNNLNNKNVMNESDVLNIVRIIDANDENYIDCTINFKNVNNVLNELKLLMTLLFVDYAKYQKDE